MAHRPVQEITDIGAGPFSQGAKKAIPGRSFYGTFEKANEHAAVATSRLKERNQKRKPPRSK